MVKNNTEKKLPYFFKIYLIALSSAMMLKKKKGDYYEIFHTSMDLSVEEIDELIDIANDIIKDRTRYQDVCRHKILATLF